MTDCIFCKIARGDFNTDFVYEDDNVVVFKDLNPTAPVHLLVVSKKHVKDIKELDDEKLMAALFNGVKEGAKNAGLESFRTVINTGTDAGQTVFHLHIHVIGGRTLNWPPG